MSPQTAPPDPYNLITNTIIAHLERGVAPWRKPWRTSAESESAGQAVQAETDHAQRIARAEAIYAAMPHRPEIRESKRDIAMYHWEEDVVEIPSLARFSTPQDYYHTLYHELIHATGLPKRLGRESIFLREELTAELGAAFLAAEAGIVSRNHEQSAEYIKRCLDVLSKPDFRELLELAANAAARAAEYNLGRLDPQKQERKPESRTRNSAAA
jgi:antirestriction protein ArdC